MNCGWAHKMPKVSDKSQLKITMKVTYLNMGQFHISIGCRFHFNTLEAYYGISALRQSGFHERDIKASRLIFKPGKLWDKIRKTKTQTAFKIFGHPISNIWIEFNFCK